MSDCFGFGKVPSFWPRKDWNLGSRRQVPGFTNSTYSGGGRVVPHEEMKALELG